MDIYIPQLTIDDVIENNLYPENITSKSYYPYIAKFINNGGWDGDFEFESEEFNEKYTLPIKTLAYNFYNSDWFDFYGIDIYEGGKFDTKNAYSSTDIKDFMKSDEMEGVSDERKGLLQSALNAVGRILYYSGGRAISSDYDENHFGDTVKPDVYGRTKKSLDSIGLIQYIYWNATGENGFQETFESHKGTKFKNKTQLKHGDIGVEYSASDSNKIIRIGIYTGKDADTGEEKWIHCSSNSGAVCNTYKGFVDYFKIMD